jgi:hypothetical protein
LTWHHACSHNPRVRQVLPLIFVVFSACCLSVVQEDATTGSASSGTSGGITGCGTTGGTSVPLPPGPCGPGTSLVGDTCVVSCAAPVTSSIDGVDSICLLPDGGFGNCADGACLAPGDPSNCGGLGLVCPAPWSCIGGSYGSYCGSLVGNAGTAFSCAAGTCPEAASECLPHYGCVSSCGPCSDNQSCSTGDSGLGFCCAGDCRAFGSDNRVGCGIRCPEGTVYGADACIPFGACGPRNSADCLFPERTGRVLWRALHRSSRSMRPRPKLWRRDRWNSLRLRRGHRRRMLRLSVLGPARLGKLRWLRRGLFHRHLHPPVRRGQLLLASLPSGRSDQRLPAELLR